MVALYIDGAYYKICSAKEVFEIAEVFEILRFDVEFREVHL